jgi:hypothetical protein
MRDPRIAEELETVRTADPNGVLFVERALEFAEANPDSALHAHLDWDDARAGRARRLDQLRGLIRVHVTVIERSSVPVEIRAYVAQPAVTAEGEKQPPRGYVPTKVVIESPPRRRELVLDVLARLDATLASYPLPELDEVAAAIRRCRDRVSGGYAEAAE